ncbi:MULTISPECIES: LysR family transcriptional regulator [Acidobacterium]|uniref:Transcriptional regulator, LysR family n=1 Tax=Acidobacterium capsulatum (strain ATCC 51196 / DSM 11244 / BCRC 80197 / JCM 7670 / NBRC 15755 / NCIMB 13165 / 161) TaxID=240015 RepID=C1F575_ACIC5|nr:MULTISPECIES: LysR family transcriptional regulator [Acidobacterium]ACO33386.1 transcriptional regulator, LysR family [Acidobacterium capsulatum ATCC 51196]HCT61190.1 LysR family transcriptional regulator [Acidobacterium sp.]
MNDWAEFRHFRYLLAILEKQGFRAAAEELHTSQPNLTVQARQFQENAQIRLFRRSRAGRIHPTETGLAFIRLARLLLELRDEVMEVLSSIERGEIVSVCFGSTPLVDPDLFRALCLMHRSLLPSATVRPTHGDVTQVMDEVLNGAIDLALVTLPVKHSELHVELIRRDRLVACLRRDSPLAAKRALLPEDLRDNLGILYDPQRHPAAHVRLLELLHEAGVQVDRYSRASHPSEVQTLVKEGAGIALVREGVRLDEQLITRPLAGVNWTVDTALVYRKAKRVPTVSLIVGKFKQKFSKGVEEILPVVARFPAHSAHEGLPPSSDEAEGLPVQLRLIG